MGDPSGISTLGMNMSMNYVNEPSVITPSVITPLVITLSVITPSVITNGIKEDA